MGGPSEPGNMGPRHLDNMRDDGPIFANLLATSILAKDQIPASLPGAEFCGPLYDLPCVYGPATTPEN